MNKNNFFISLSNKKTVDFNDSSVKFKKNVKKMIQSLPQALDFKRKIFALPEITAIIAVVFLEVKMKKFFILSVFVIIFSFFVSPLSAKEAVQAAILHNDGYTLYQEFRPNDNTYKNTVRDMEVLASKHKNKVFSQAASLVKTIQNKCKKYYDINTKLIEMLKQKWSKPHYADMDEEWKETTFSKDRKKVQDIHRLSLGMQQAYNDWNELRNKAFEKKDVKEIAKELEKANNTLKMTIDGVLAEEKPAMDAVAKELEIMKMSK